MENIDANEKYGNENEKCANKKRSESTFYVVTWEILMQMEKMRMKMSIWKIWQCGKFESFVDEKMSIWQKWKHYKCEKWYISQW